MNLNPKWHGNDPAGLGYYTIEAGGALLYLEQRPAYCDRGSWIVKIDNPGPMWIDDADMFPRYYFKLENALDEIEAFLLKRGVLK